MWVKMLQPLGLYYLKVAWLLWTWKKYNCKGGEGEARQKNRYYGRNNYKIKQDGYSIDPLKVSVNHWFVRVNLDMGLIVAYAIK